MGAGVDNSSGVKNGRRRWKPAAEINVTPFVDVMLVLLIVFMISAPLLTVGIEVDLPDTEARAMTTSEEPLTITIQSDGTIFLMETAVGFDELGPRLQAIAGTRSAARVYIRADQGVAYGDVVRVMARVSASGYPNIGLVTDPVRD